jgi:hypothetical protein
MDRRVQDLQLRVRVLEQNSIDQHNRLVFLYEKCVELSDKVGVSMGTDGQQEQETITQQLPRSLSLVDSVLQN